MRPGPLWEQYKVALGCWRVGGVTTDKWPQSLHWLQNQGVCPIFKNLRETEKEMEECINQQNIVQYFISLPPHLQLAKMRCTISTKKTEYTPSYLDSTVLGSNQNMPISYANMSLKITYSTNAQLHCLSELLAVTVVKKKSFKNMNCMQQ